MRKIQTKTGSIAYARYQLKRSILESILENNYSEEEHAEALKYFNGCAFCGEPLAARKDHLVPVMNNGDFIRNNIVPACQECDDSKGQKEFKDWMRNSNSPKSLRKRKRMSDEEIERRIKRIEEWQEGYKSKTEKQLFGQYYPKYLELIKRMGTLCEEAKKLVNDVRSLNSKDLIIPHAKSNAIKKSGSTADKIRQFVLINYIIPGRERGEKTAVVRSGDIHSQMKLHGQHANVCQTLKGYKLQEVARVILLSVTGPKAGGNTFFRYKL